MALTLTTVRRTCLVSAMLVGFACGSSEGPVLEASGSNFDEIVAQYGDWNGALADTTPAPPVDLPQTALTAGNNDNWICQNTQIEKKRNLDQLLLPGNVSGVLWPGALIQGATLIDGTPAGIPLPRSPITVSIDLAVEHPSAQIANPTSASVQAAVASLQRDADSRLGPIDLVPARVDFAMTEAHASNQVMLEVGMYARGSVPTAMLGIQVPGTVSLGVQVEAGLTVSFERHTIAVKLMQPMYTISFADEEKFAPGEYLDPAVTEAQLRDAASRGLISPTNLPTYVKSVTYGRMVIYTMTNTQTATTAELQSATQAALNLFNKASVSGGSKLSAKDSLLLQNSEVRIVAFGGSQDSALAAIRTGDLGKFFTSVPATQAVPLGYRIHYLKNGRVATLGMGTTYTRSNCTPVPGSRARYWHIRFVSVTKDADCDSSSYFREAYIKASGNSLALTRWLFYVLAGPMTDTTVNREMVLLMPTDGSGLTDVYLSSRFDENVSNTLTCGGASAVLCSQFRHFVYSDQIAVNPYTLTQIISLPGIGGVACTATFTWRIFTEPALSPPVRSPTGGAAAATTSRSGA